MSSTMMNYTINKQLLAVWPICGRWLTTVQQYFDKGT